MHIRRYLIINIRKQSARFYTIAFTTRLPNQYRVAYEEGDARSYNVGGLPCVLRSSMYETATYKAITGYQVTR